MKVRFTFLETRSALYIFPKKKGAGFRLLLSLENETGYFDRRRNKAAKPANPIKA